MSNVQHILAALDCKQRQTIRHSKRSHEAIAVEFGYSPNEAWKQAVTIVVESNV
jgi:hypothetical protein